MNVEDDAGNFRVIAQAGKFAHQRDAGTRRRSHGPRSRPSRSQDHADGGELIFSLHHGERCLAVGAYTETPEIVDQRLYQRRRWSDRIPSHHRDAGKHAAQGRRRVAIHDDLALRLIRRLNYKRVCLSQRGGGVIVSRLDGCHIQVSGFLLALELLAHRVLYLLHVQAKQLRRHADVDHVLDQLAEFGFRTHRRHQLVVGDGIKDQILAQGIQFQRLVKQNCGAGGQRQHILACRLRVHGDEKINLFFAGDVAVFIGADGVPGRQSGDVGRKKIFPRDRHAHLEDGAQQHGIG